MWQDVGLMGIIIGNAITLLIWWLNRNEQSSRIYKSQQETISAAIDDIAQLREEFRQVKKERDELAEGVLILTKQLVKNNLDPEWKPK